ncbi:MAG TPA: sigma-70 family RNA polymerase sigma factor [Acidimicrobiales bacterium]|nr:sigma-70 family RNA polymerase sigma factor [Acidimicrobiales bacterium]
MSASEVYLTEEDDAAFSEVYRAHHAKLLRYCQYRLRDRHEAEDVAQEAFVRAWRSMPTSAYDRNFYPWLRVVAGNLCTDVLRKRSRSEPTESIEIPGIDHGLEQITEDVDRVLVRQALGRLNDRHRTALMMREDEGLTYEQIAARSGVTSATVESLLWRARQALKREFTVLAGGERMLAFLPMLLVLVDRLRSGGRRAYVRVARRIPGLSGNEVPSGHAVLAAFAAITVVTGVAATVSMSPNSGAAGNGSRPVATASALTVTSSTASKAAAPTTPATTAATTPAPTPSTSDPQARPPVTAAVPVPSTVAAGSSPPTFHVGTLVTSGTAQNRYAHNAPAKVTAGNLTVGVAPQVVAEYMNKAVQTVKTLLPVLSTPQSTKETSK